MNRLNDRLPTALAAALLAGILSFAGRAEAETWNFDVYLDGKRIGEHRFALEREDDGLVRVESDARFDVKVLGITVFRYRHAAEERWSAGCLEALVTTTEVNRKRYEVIGGRRGDAFEVASRGDGDERRETLPACVATYAYWDPDLLVRHEALLNGQTGAYQPVGRQVALDDEAEAARLELTGADFTIGLSYRGDGFWDGLRTTTRDGRTLEYRLAGRQETAFL